MPIIYLSPSTQDWNYYVNGGTEEEWMNLLADKMVPYLDASGIRYTRNTPDMTAASSIAASNAGNYDLHLALHSNAAAGAQAGKARGAIVFYYPGSTNGQRAAELIADGLKTIYPDPNKVRTEATTSLGEVARVNAPAVLVELAFHDNPEDANWIKANLDAAARVIALALTEYFDIPFFETENRRSGVVDVEWGNLNVRARPSTSAAIVAQAPDGAPITVLNTANGWHLVNYNGTIGYVSSEFVTLT